MQGSDVDEHESWVVSASMSTSLLGFSGGHLLGASEHDDDRGDQDAQVQVEEQDVHQMRANVEMVPVVL